jgi:hypothetical protein
LTIMARAALVPRLQLHLFSLAIVSCRLSRTTIATSRCSFFFSTTHGQHAWSACSISFNS